MGRLIAILVVAGVGYGLYKAYQNIQSLSNYEIKPNGYKLVNVGLNRAKIVVQISIKNNSNIKVNVDSYNLLVSVNGKQVAIVQDATRKELPANSFTIIDIPVEFSPKEAVGNIVTFSNLTALITNSDKIKIGVKGDVSITGDTFVKIDNIPVDFVASLKQLQEKK